MSGFFEVVRRQLEIQVDRNSGSEIPGPEVQSLKSCVHGCIHMSKVGSSRRPG